ncbi:MAG: protein kinase, partial [Planctomycetes bacterium]|nr:protein kinase [Planctomycetota bacterium]
MGNESLMPDRVPAPGDLPGPGDADTRRLAEGEAAGETSAAACDIRIALFGPAGAGKTETLRRMSESLGAMGRASFVAIDNRDRSTLCQDYLFLDMGSIEGLRLRFHFYTLPGREAYALAARMGLHAADAVVVTVDGRDGRLAETLAALKRLEGILAEAGKDLRTMPKVFQANKRDLARRDGGGALTERRLKSLGAPVVVTQADRGEGIRDLFKAVVGEVLGGIARTPGLVPMSPRGKPGPVRVDDRSALEADAANEIYLRTFSSTTTSFTPHSETFLGAILEKFEMITNAQFREAMELRRRAARNELELSLGEVLTKKGWISTEDLERAQRLKASAEVIHEEILYGKIALEDNLVPFERFRETLLFQKSAHFQYGLGFLLLDAGDIRPEDHLRVLKELEAVHREETEREAGAGEPLTAAIRRPESKDRKTQMFFGSLAVKNKFITQAQLDEALRIQKSMREKGVNKYLGVILQEKGFLKAKEVEIICSSLERHLAKNPIDGYKIEASLGRGAMGLVYAAQQLKLGRTVALKVLDPKHALDADYIQKFYQEAHVAATLNHPNIVQAFDVGESAGYHYFAMEYVQGVTVKQILEERSVMDEKEAVAVVMQVVSALHHAERLKLAHLDIKPSNIMITHQGMVKLCDLGLAKRTDTASESSEKQIMGSPYYISPEQIERNPTLDSRADIYSLGATLFHMVCGKPPFDGADAQEIFLKHLTARLPDPGELNPKLSIGLRPVLKKMLEKNR